jgi:hypothetical protein
MRVLIDIGRYLPWIPLEIKSEYVLYVKFDAIKLSTITLFNKSCIAENQSCNWRQLNPSITRKAAIESASCFSFCAAALIFW